MGQAPSDDPFYTVAGDTIYGTYIPSDTSSSGGSSGGSAPGTGPVVAETSGGITINLLFDAAAMAAPASFRAGIAQAAAILASTISDKITVNLNIDYSGTGGGAAAGPDSGLFENYSTIRSDLVNGATPGDATFNALPTGSSIQGQSSVAVWNAQLKLWGFLGANDTTTDDGSATFATDINPNLLVGVALHELTHAMGRVPYGPQPDVFDLYRFTSIGTRLFAGGNTAPAAYFSTDGGHTKIADFGQTSDPSDFLNSGVQGPNDPFDEFYDGSTIQGLTSVDKQILDALGFHTMTPVRTVIEAFGSTSLVEVGSNYFLNPVNGGNGPQLEYQSTPVTAGQFGTWIPVGAEQVSGGGYEVAWRLPGTDEFSLWTADSDGNYVSTSGTIGATSSTLETAETVLHQDLNGDGVIGAATASIIEQAGSTRLLQLGGNYYLDSIGTGYGPEFLYGGSPVTTGEFGSWTYIGAEQVSGGGYDVALHVPGSDQYTVWGTDSSGNVVSNLTGGTVSGTSNALESLESIFNQDLNGDGTIGIAPIIISAYGSTELAQVGSNYFLNPVGGGTGPELKYGGTAVTIGEFGAWTFVGVGQVTGGYDVALHLPGSDQYTVWGTDSNGNVISNAAGGIVSGTSSTLESLEPTFHQDLNGDGTIGVPTTVIETYGSTALAQVGSNYFFNPVGGGTGPEFKYGGTPVTAGEFGSWTFIGAEQIAGGGYDVALHLPGSDQYTVWGADSSGNVISNAAGGIVSGTSSALESLEPTFHQDLNGDGTIGVPTTVIETYGSTALAQVGNNYFFNPVGGGTGPELKYSGTPVTAGEFGSWTFIGAEQVAGGGYDVVLHLPGSDQYTVWDTDNSGNVISNAVGGIVSGTSSALESLEPTFHQDLNGDGTIGVPTTVIETYGSTALAQVGNNYFFNPVGGGTGPELKYSGTPVTAGEFGSWTFIGAEQVAGGGYDVALHLPGSDQYTVWDTDNSGNVISNAVGGIVSGTSSALESLEPTFHQDLNGDGTIGPKSPAAPAPGPANNVSFVFADNNSSSPATVDFSAPAAQTAMNELASIFNSPGAEIGFVFAVMAGNQDAVGYFNALEASPHPDAHLIQLINSFIIH